MHVVDRDTQEWGVEPPFEWWEGGQSALTLVLQDAFRSGLTLEVDADVIAAMVVGSRWFAAATADHARSRDRDFLAARLRDALQPFRAPRRPRHLRLVTDL